MCKDIKGKAKVQLKKFEDIIRIGHKIFARPLIFIIRVHNMYIACVFEYYEGKFMISDHEIYIEEFNTCQWTTNYH